MDWSPDGSSLLVRYNVAHERVVEVLSVDGSDSRRRCTRRRSKRLRSRRGALDARWHRDRRRVGRQRIDDRMGDPWAPFPGETAWELAERRRCGTAGDPPDGAQTAVATLHSEGGVRTTPTEAAVFVVDSATGAARQIAAHEATSEMAFSPDGQRLAFATDADIIGNPTGLVVAATDASGERGLDDCRSSRMWPGSATVMFWSLARPSFEPTSRPVRGPR